MQWNTTARTDQAIVALKAVRLSVTSDALSTRGKKTSSLSPEAQARWTVRYAPATTAPTGLPLRETVLAPVAQAGMRSFSAKVVGVAAVTVTVVVEVEEAGNPATCRTARKGTVLAAKAVDAQGKGGVLPARS